MADEMGKMNYTLSLDLGVMFKEKYKEWNEPIKQESFGTFLSSCCGLQTLALELYETNNTRV